MKTMRTATKLSLGLMVLLVALAPALANDARVRVIHASPDAPPVDIVVNDSLRLFEDAEFGQTTSYKSVPANVYNVKVTPAGAAPSDNVIDADLNLLYGKDYTVIAVDLLDNITPLVLEDSNEPVPFNNARVRFVHGSPGAPAVDIKVVDGPFLFQDVEFTEVGDYVTVPDGLYDLEVRVAGTDTVVLTLSAIDLERGTTYTVVANGIVGGEPALGVSLSEDNFDPSARSRRPFLFRNR